MQALRRALLAAEPGGPGFSALDVVAETGSTNADLLARPAALDRTVLLADHQVSGRGRVGRAWTSPPRTATATSVLLRPDVPRERWSWLPLLTALAVTDALRERARVDAVVKWPNDVLVAAPGGGHGGDARKVCGILVEVGADGRVVCGWGLNVLQRADELPVADPDAVPAPTPATSLLLEGAAVTDRDTLARAGLRAFEARLRAWVAAGGDPVRSGQLSDYRAACDTLGREVRVHRPGGDVLTGAAEDVTEDGRLVVRPAGSVPVHLSAGDVVHVRPVPGSARRG